MQVVDLPAVHFKFWIRDAWRMFRAAPLAWMVLSSAWLAITFVLLVIPFLGQLVANLLQPLFFAGLMIACRAQDRGGQPQLGHLFAAFKTNAPALVAVGGVLLVGTLGVIALLAALGLPEIPIGVDDKVDVESVRAAFDGKEWLVVLGLALISLLKGALWYAPPLLAFHKMSAVHAMRWSLYAFLSNFGAMFFYGIAIVVITALAVIPYGAGLFIAIPIMIVSNYTGYKATFREDAAVA